MAQSVTDTHRWLATALKRAEKLLATLREKTSLDEDWLDDVESGTHDLFRDLAVAYALSARAVDWVDEPDPLDVIRRAKPFPVTKAKEILAALHEVDAGEPDSPEKSYCLVSDSEDALGRLGHLLRSLAKLRTDEENERARGRLDDLITPTEW